MEVQSPVPQMDATRTNSALSSTEQASTETEVPLYSIAHDILYGQEMTKVDSPELCSNQFAVSLSTGSADDQAGIDSHSLEKSVRNERSDDDSDNFGFTDDDCSSFGSEFQEDLEKQVSERMDWPSFKPYCYKTDRQYRPPLPIVSDRDCLFPVWMVVSIAALSLTGMIGAILELFHQFRY